ncbi:MAG: LptF/LptG family permease [Pirellulales bacterium]
MRIIDRYLLRQFVQSLLICFCSLTGLYIVIDAFANLDQFIEHADQQGSLLAVLGDFYAYQSLAFFDRTSGILALIAAMFTLTWIQRHNELTALLAAGVPKLRVIRPIIIAALCVSLVATIARELVIPQVRHKIARDIDDLSGESAQQLQPRYDNHTDILLGGETTIRRGKRISAPSFMLPYGLDQYGRQLSAEEAVYREANEDHPAGYLLRKVIEPESICQQPTLLKDEKPVIITPPDAPWLEPQECFVVSGVSFEMIEGGATWRDFSSTGELIRGLASSGVDFGADVRVAVHMRFVQPLLDCTLLLLGLPLVLSRGRNVFVAIGLCVLVGGGFMLVVLACQALGTGSWISPALAAWMPLMIFAPLAIALADPLRD